MLQIIKCGFSSNAHYELVEKILSRTEKQKRSILIVPEQQTVVAESELAKVLPSYAPLYFEATNFTRLSNSAFRALGGISGEYCDKGKRALIMWRTLTELSPILSMTQGKREVNAGLVERALLAIGEMQNLGISPAELYEIEVREEIKSDKRLSSKLSDLTRIYSVFKDRLTEKYNDNADDISVMIKKLSENKDFLSDTEIFIEGFTSFTEPQYRLITALLERTAITVYITLPKLREDAFEYSETRHTETRLKRCARLQGTELKVTHFRETNLNKSETLSEIAELLWAKTCKIDNITLQNPEELRIFEAKTPFDEADFIATDIKRRILNGAAYSDFAIIASSLSDYEGIIDAALTRRKIPIFASYKRDISSFEIIKLIYTAYAIIRGGFKREDVLTYAKCGLSGISRDECDEFEMYVNKWQINGARFTDGIIWNMNPDGLVPHKEGDDERLLRINETRSRLILPLMLFRDENASAATVKDLAASILNLLLSLDCEDKLIKLSEKLEALGEVYLADVNKKLWQLILDALDSFVEVSGDSECSPDAFLSQLKILFSSLEVGQIPAFRDVVTLGGAEMLRLYRKKHIYLIGVNEGEFPKQIDESSYFSEKDREVLSSLGLAIEPDREIKAARELYIFTRSFSYADESVTLLYTNQNSRFKSTKPSEVIARISSLTGSSVVPRKISELSCKERLYSDEDALSEPVGNDEKTALSIKSALSLLGHKDKLAISEGDIRNTRLEISKDAVSKIYGTKTALTQSRIDSYRSCPMAHFCKYTVRLSREECAEFNAPGIGTFIHAILENFFSLLTKDGREPRELSATDRYSLTMSAAKKYIMSLGEEATDTRPEIKVKLDRLCKSSLPIVDGLCEEFSESLFRPQFFELAIKKDSELSPEPVNFKAEDGTDISVYGVIDRVDTYKQGDDVYVRVVDYKTGQKSFSPEDIEEGKNLQMFLYLKSILDTEKESFKREIGVNENGRIIPAGVVYVKTDINDKFVSLPNDSLAKDAVMNAQERQGMVLDSEDVISAMGLRYTPLYSSKSKNKIPDSKRNLLFTEDSFKDIIKKVENAVVSVSKEMKSGQIPAAPSLDNNGAYACAYCEFKPICRFVRSKKR